MTMTTQNANTGATLAAKMGTFIRGLNLLQPLQLCLLGSSFALQRFGYDKNMASVFVGLCHNSMELVYLCSAISSYLLLLLSKSHPKFYTWFSFIFSSLSVCFTVAVNVLLLVAYKEGDLGEGMTHFYWLLVLANFAAGIDDMCISTIAADALSQYDFGQAMTGLVVAGLHWGAMYVIEIYEKDLNYWLIFSQIIFITGLSAVAAVVWIWYLVEKTIKSTTSGSSESSSSTGKFWQGLGQSLPMMLVSTIGYGIIYIIYPLISPFEMVEFDYHYPIQRACLIFHALSGLTVWAIDQLGGLKGSWYKGHLGWLHLLWLLVIPFFGTGFLFVYIMHHPKTHIAEMIMNKPLIVGILTVIYYYTGRFTTGISYVAIAANAEGCGEMLSALNLVINLLTLNSTKYVSEAYIQQFRVAMKNYRYGDPWPTQGMSKYDAFLYWVKVGITKGYENFKELATTDIQERLGGTQNRVVHYRNVSKPLPRLYKLSGGWKEASPEDIDYFAKMDS